MAEKANGFELEIKKKAGGGVFADVKGLKELNIPALQKDTIELTNFDQSVRTYMGGMIDFGELSFKTDFYPSHFHWSLFPSDTLNHTNTINESIDINGTFDDTEEGGQGDSGWASDTGGGFTIVNVSGNRQAHLDLSDDSTDPTYLRRENVGTNLGKLPTDRGSVYSLAYSVHAITGTDGILRWEYAGNASSNTYYNTANGFSGYQRLGMSTAAGTNRTNAVMTDAPAFKLIWSGDSESSASINLDSLNLYKLYSWQDLFLNDIELECRIKDPSGATRLTFDAFITNCDVQSPLDGIIEHDLTLKVNGAVTYG